MSEEDTKTAERFAIPRDSVSDERLDALKIKILDTVTLFDRTCILIGKAAVKKLADYGYYTERTSPTKMDGVIFVALMNPDRSRARADIDPKTIRLVEFVNKPTTEGEAGKVQQRFMEFLRDRLGAVVDKSLKVVFGNFAVVQKPTSTDRFHVILAGSPSPGTVRIPATLWSKKAGGATGARQQFGFSPYFDGTPLFAPEGEFGAYDANMLVIYTNPIHSGTDADFEVLEQMVATFERVRTHGMKVEVEVIKSTYIDTCMHRVDAEIKATDESMKEDMERIKEAQDTIVNRTRDYNRKQQTLTSLLGGGAGMREKLGKEFDNLCKHDRVKNLFWRGNRLIVETKCLHFVDPRSKKEHELGEMRLILETEPFSVRFYNMTRQVRAFRNDLMHGPHLFPSGEACLGNMGNVIPKLVGEYRFKDAVTQAIAFCESVNVNDGAGELCNLWPLSERQKQLDAAGKA